MKRKTISVCMFTLLILLSFPSALAQPPTPPCLFYGYVLVGGSPAQDGLNVTAVISGATLNWTKETGGGTYGWEVMGSSLLVIPSENTSAPGKDGGVTGNTVVFYVQGVRASQTGTFESGGAKRLDLSITGIPGQKSNAALTVSLECPTAYAGYKVKIGGTLAYTNGTSIPGAVLLLTYWTTGGASWNNITSVTTTVNGDYNAEWMPNTTGSYLIKVSWEGNQTLSVPGAEADVSLAVTPLENKYVLSVVSSSNLSELVFNSTSRVLNFTLLGSSGELGYANITIAKDLIGEIGGVKVNLDDSAVYYTYTSTDVSWLLYFTYVHSTHTVGVELSSPGGPFMENLLIIASVFAIIVLAGVAVYVVRGKLRLRHKKPRKLP